MQGAQRISSRSPLLALPSSFAAFSGCQWGALSLSSETLGAPEDFEGEASMASLKGVCFPIAVFRS